MSSRIPLLTMPISNETDVVAVRQRARRIAELIGFDTQDQTRIATAVSEIARNAFEYAGGGMAAFRLEAVKGKPQSFIVSIRDEGPGIADTDAILEGRYKSQHGMGIGISGARRLVDEFQIQSGHKVGTTVELGKHFSGRQRTIEKSKISKIVDQISREGPEADPLRAIAFHNVELARNLEEMSARQRELRHLSQELEDTNRGVVALYSELEQKADELRQASELKTRFLSHMSHEFRTPLNSILALSDLLLKRVDGELTEEQETQVSFIKRSAESLHELVNDLLDIAKLEAGRVDVRLSTFGVADLMGGLRGVLKPLEKGNTVKLIFEDPPADLPPITSDEGKLVQIIRNFVSNALKFTLEGEVRIRVHPSSQSKTIRFAVSDTGIGIAPEHRERVFEEFSQIDSPTQRLVKGTGLGLSLCRKLAEVLHGKIELVSAEGKGSTFTLEIPLDLDLNATAPANFPNLLGEPEELVKTRRSRKEMTVLIADDDPVFRYTLRQLIVADEAPYNVIEAPDGVECYAKARDLKPDVIVLDLQMPRRDGYQVLEDLSADPMTKGIPVVLSSSADLDLITRERIATARGFLPKRELSRETVAAALDRILENR
ncbi:MAG: response regulator [Proteobacteria bacterium]|nr:response regulator [Pseudomonadota bacterium]